MQLIDHLGRPLSLSRELGRGGEGAVFEIAGHPDHVAKVYHASVDQSKAQKLLCMALMTSQELTRLAAWPTAVLFDTASKLPRGITMPRIKSAKEIHILYSPAQRRTHFPAADWHFLIRAARNCARSFATLHQSGVVVGDVNQGNILVDAQALVRLIDCDSFQLNAQGKVYRCTVGVSHFTPPELQACRFELVDRTQNHDGFGLAVIIFHLLFMGRHPFAGKFSGRGEMPTIEDAISQYRFAFGADAPRFQVAPPPGSPTLGIVTPEIAQLFERSFVRGSETPAARPKAAEWDAALERLEASLMPCPADPGHRYVRHRGSCPWCGLATTSGTNFFISVTLERIAAAPRCDVSEIWNRILSVPDPDDILRQMTVPLPSSIVAKPRPSGVDDKQTLINAIGATAVGGMIIAVVAFTAGIVGLGIALLVLSMIAGGAWFYFYRESPLGRERAARGAILREAEYEWKRAAAALSSRVQHFSDTFGRSFASFSSARGQLEDLDKERANRLGELQRNAVARQFTDYMEQFNIADADIPNIGSTRAALLAYHGIETARDVPDADTIMAIQGFGEVLANSLVAWKNRIASGFQFNAAKGLPAVDIQALGLQFQQRRLQLESILRGGETELRRVAEAAKDELGPLNRRATVLKHNVDQARADLRAL